MPKKITKTVIKKKSTGVSIPVVGVNGKAKSRIQLPKELFAAKVNKALLAQAVRVYLANQRRGTAATKTRGEVEGSTRKIYRQKGTGRARHGAIRAPIFIGGGIVFGPKPRDFSLKMPQKMRRAALASALTAKFSEGNLIVMDGLADIKKTKDMAQALRADTKTLLVTDARGNRAARNIAYVDVIPANMLSAYTVLSHQKLVFTKEAIKSL